MSTARLRALINSATFPHVYSHTGRTIVDTNDLNAKMPTSFYGSKENIEYGVPQLVFCENVLPITRGLAGAGFQSVSGPYAPGGAFFEMAVLLRDPQENVMLLSPAQGKNMLYDAVAGTWTPGPQIDGAVDKISVAYVNGRTFVFYEQTQLFEYDSVLNTLVPVMPTLPVGYAITDIRLIGAASNYLILCTETEVLWGSLLAMLDFADTEHGAGGQIPVDIQGHITAIKQSEGGFIIYTTKNGVGATFTNIAASPFAFKGIENCGGVLSPEQVTTAPDGGHFVWSTAGLQKVDLRGVVSFSPDVTDFLVGRKASFWNPTTKTVDETEYVNPFAVKLAFIGERYLFVSYGESRHDMIAALVFDATLDRWGKINISHTDISLFPDKVFRDAPVYEELVGTYAALGSNTAYDYALTQLIVQSPKHGFLILQKDGSVKLLTVGHVDNAANSVAVFGHMQYDRGGNITLHKVEVEGGYDIAVYMLPSNTGVNRDQTVTVPKRSELGNLQYFSTRTTAKNFDVAIEGAFTLTNLLIEVTKHGRR